MTRKRLRDRLVGWSLPFTIAGSIGCHAIEESRVPDLPPFPSFSMKDTSNVVTFQFGPAHLQTKNDIPWGGGGSITLPPLFDPRAGPVSVEIQGLDLSSIRYTGDLDQTPDSTDSGAFVDVGLAGSSGVAYRIHSKLSADRRTLWTGQELPSDALADYRAYVAYLMLGWPRDQPRFGGGAHHFAVESWSHDSRPEYGTFDLRLKYGRGTVSNSIRLHASHAWDNGNRAIGDRCPWNPAINTAVEETADQVWQGECVRTNTSTSGRTKGAWVGPLGPASLQAPIDGGPLQVRVSIVNWANARGPYRVSWSNLVVSGVPLSGAGLALGTGRFIPIGTADVAAFSPRGCSAAFSFVAVARDGGRPRAAQLRYRTAGFDLVSSVTEFVLVDSSSVRVGGTATVNGEGGYRFEFRVTDSKRSGGTSELSITVRYLGRPVYVAFGTLTEGEIRVWAP